jgi:glutamate/tyrosine decarboxylase-like PLP-dependent enzyme
VCAQAGEVNTGAFDPFAEIADACAEAGAWLHVEGAFELWASVSPDLRPLLAGIERADSWATDAHKWLNVPYDSGIVFVRPTGSPPRGDVGAGRVPPYGEAEEREQMDWNPESSRRARGFPV